MYGRALESMLSSRAFRAATFACDAFVQATRRVGGDRRGARRGSVPDGRALHGRVERGELDPEELDRALLLRPIALVRDRDLRLLRFNARLRATGAREASLLNGYLRAHNLPTIVSLPSEGNLLADLRWEAKPRLAGGPLVSVLMSAYNARHTIEYAIGSILDQSHTNLELLVCDDASEDGTLDFLRDRYGSDPRVRLFRSTRNQGTYNIRNHLLRHARGSLVTQQDADDFALPTRIAEQVRAFRDPRVVACVSDWVRVRPDGSFVFFHDRRATRLAIVSTMSRRDALDAVGPYRSARFGADLEQLERLRRLGGRRGVVRIARPLIFGLWGPRSITRAQGAESLETGYRSPARRRYSDLVALQQRHGKALVPDDYIDSQLRESGNYVEPADVVGVTEMGVCPVS